MSRTKTITVYAFDELSATAKDVARDWYREHSRDDFESHADDVYQTAAQAADWIGISLRQKPVKLMNNKVRYDPEIHYSGFYSQGDGACYAGTYSYVAGGAKAIADEFPTDEELNRIARTLEIVQRIHGQSIGATIQTPRGNSVHSRSMQIFIERTDDVADPLHNPLPEATETLVTELLRAFADWIYARLEAEYAYINSNEYVDEMLSDGYGFDIDGQSI